MLAGAALRRWDLAPGTKSPEKFGEQLSERPNLSAWIREKIR
tara:strand:- start:55 stop:180 length:126 start_codon:yes stop_codon:yes gene_type:complete